MVGGKKLVGEGSNPQISESSILFNATYADRVRDIVVADNGVDINLMGEILLNTIQCAEAKMHVMNIPGICTIEWAQALHRNKSLQK